MTAKAIRIPITNHFGGGDYTAQILVGSENAALNVILDTGSSTLAVKQGTYKPASDKNLKATTFAQDITYGTGGWAGPVVTTNLTMGVAGSEVTLQNAPLAVTIEQEPSNFGRADGILGLAYNQLNNAFNLQAYLIRKGLNPPNTFPWPFPVQNSQAAIDQFQQFLRTMHEEDIPPYFMELEEKGLTANKFAFYTLRSMPSAKNASLNKGFFILGGGEEQNDLYQGDFVNVDVVQDDFYGTNLKSIQVGGANPVKVRPLQGQPNSIVDSGTNSLALSHVVFNAIMQSLTKINAEFAQLGMRALTSRNGIASSLVDLKNWPTISFILAGENGEDINLTCSPQTYWQFDSPSAGQATFQINDFAQNGASILGLPLLNNYYTVFDRATDVNGVIRFAPIKQS